MPPLTSVQANPFTLHEVKASDASWQAFASENAAPFFCSPLWSQVLDAGYGIQTSVYLLKKHEEVLLALPAAKFDFALFQLIHAYTPYGEFVGDLAYISDFMEHLEEKLSREGIHQIRMTQLAHQHYALPKTFRAYWGCQHSVDLHGVSEESLWTGYKKNIRRDVRIAQKAGVTIEKLETPEQIDLYYAMYKKTMERKRALGPHPRKLYHEIAKQLGAKDQATFLVAKYQGKYIGGVILIFSGPTVYLLGNASDADFLQLCPNDLLIHESLTLTLKRGCRYFDFMTTGESFEAPGRLSAFKEKWGAVRYPFTVYEKDLSPWRARLWNHAWKLANTPFGSALLRRFLNK